MTKTPFGQQNHASSQRRADQATPGARVRWTEWEINQLSESDARVLMQVATLRSWPHDLFVIRWCTVRIRQLHNSVVGLNRSAELRDTQP